MADDVDVASSQVDDLGEDERFCKVNVCCSHDDSIEKSADDIEERSECGNDEKIDVAMTTAESASRSFQDRSGRQPQAEADFASSYASCVRGEVENDSGTSGSISSGRRRAWNSGSSTYLGLGRVHYCTVAVWRAVNLSKAVDGNNLPSHVRSADIGRA
jgi:hypothetical protein